MLDDQSVSTEEQGQKSTRAVRKALNGMLGTNEPGMNPDKAQKIMRKKV